MRSLLLCSVLLAVVMVANANPAVFKMVCDGMNNPALGAKIQACIPKSDTKGQEVLKERETQCKQGGPPPPPPGPPPNESAADKQNRENAMACLSKLAASQ